MLHDEDPELVSIQSDNQFQVRFACAVCKIIHLLEREQRCLLNGGYARL